MTDFSSKLIAWYLENKRDLPWRGERDPYRIWLSEIILQQTRVEQGKPYYFRFIESFPTVQELAVAQEDAVLKLWQGLGYYSRARNLHATAKKVANDLDGNFPDTYKGLKELKGVGDYTASAIASICFDEAAAVVDGNVYRMLSRIFGIGTAINSSAGQKEFKALAQMLIDKKDPATFNQAIMEFGATQCKPKNPYCLHCPFNTKCVALQQNKIDGLPVKKTKVKVRDRYFNYIVFISEEKGTVLHQRMGKGIWQGLFEFPLLETKKNLAEKDFGSKFKGIVLKDRSGNEIVPRFTTENVSLYNDKPILHKLSHQNLFVKFWILRVRDLKGLESISIDDLGDYAVPRVIDRFLEGFDFSAG